MRILISPQPKNTGGPGVFLKRVALELSRRGYRWTSTPYHYTGLSVIPWQYCFMMGCPRHHRKLLAGGRPLISTMGKPESREEHQAVHRVYRPEYDLHREEMARVIEESPRVVFISHYVKEIWQGIFAAEQRCFPGEERSTVIHHGVDTEIFRPCEGRSYRPDEPFVIGTAGALRNGYRLETLFRVSRALDFEHRLLIVGSLNQEVQEVFASAMQDPELAARTTHVPWVDAAELPRYYGKMHCLFHPVDYEGCGVVVGEALACGVPVVVPAHGAPQEYLLPAGGVTVATRQFCYDDDFCARMAQGVSRVRDEWASFASGARQSALSYLTVESTVGKYLDLMGLPQHWSN